MKLPSYYRAVLTAACSGLLLLAGCYEVKVSFESETTQSNASAVDSSEKNQSESAIASTLSTTASTSKNSLFAYHQSSASKGVGQGTLRMSNQTEQPVRLALLARRSQLKSSSEQANSSLPAHWDFAPGEGSEKGLILSLPNENLKLHKGDILVAFAQDGSRRYWGPYVVGETSTPVWNPQKQEWELILSP
ncbi:hypothetical protein QUB80_08085 [Chlorogloeopsis sp. ULAP01]|uniref:hypothetical protein n=1 Tax=Chlorogloeopsis sp. ULAP01 TaxID=3056483 RepID=UPI0025AAE6DA|nr:hypothetical protein [Chlorogloeopsis sp. ULAP01]MDM9380663.1 hypothetical protein [Chlorogloeopsis sp. ULAP01]